MEPAPLPAFLIGYSNADFTNPHEVVLPEEPRDCRGSFTHMGAKYWGFETRRHRATTVNAAGREFEYDHNAHHWLQIGLKKRALVEKLRISTKWYTGNQVRAVTVILKDELTGRETRVLERVALAPDAEHEFAVPPTSATECLVECYYEGGIARIVLFGATTAEQMPHRANLLEDAVISHVSNQHYGRPEQAVRGCRAEMHMVGWESARTGFGERALFHLAKPAVIREVVVDTYLHRLNAPLSCHVFALNFPAGEAIDGLMNVAPRWKAVFDDGAEEIPEDFQAYMIEQRYFEGGKAGGREKFKIRLHHPADSPWKAVLPFAPLAPDTFHRFAAPENIGAVTHVLYMHYPNGGIHSLGVYGA